MSAPDIDAAVKARLLAWAATADNPPEFAFPNDGYQPVAETPWCYVEREAGFQETTRYSTTRVVTAEGWIWCHLFVPTGTGSEDARVMAAAIGSALGPAKFGGIDTFAHKDDPGSTSPGSASSDEDLAGWWRISFSIPYVASWTVVAG